MSDAANATPSAGPEHWPVRSLFVTWIVGGSLLIWLAGAAGLLREGSWSLELAISVATYTPPMLWAAWKLRRDALPWSVLLGPPLAQRPWRRWLGLTAGLVALSLGALWVLWYPVSLVAPGFVEEYVLENEPTLLVGSTPAARWTHAAATSVVIVVLAPLVEELICRGLLLRRWTAKWGVAPAVVATSIFFGVLHVDLLGSVYFGFAMCVLAVRSGGVRAPIVVHALNNALAVVVVAIDEAFELSWSEATLEEFQGQGVWALPLFVVAAAWAVWWGRRALRTTPWPGRRAAESLPPGP